jgi:hypothetical protein
MLKSSWFKKEPLGLVLTSSITRECYKFGGLYSFHDQKQTP